MKFTEAQKEAIEWPPANIQLIACAGSGKTEVIAQRVAMLLKDPESSDLAPRNIVAFTFTEKAAGELKDRIVTRVKEVLGPVNGMAEMYVGTIHGFCLEILKTEVPQYLKYSVLRDTQQVLFVNRNSSKSGLTMSTDLKGTKLRRYVDTKNYISAMNILREARINESKLKSCTVAAGLHEYNKLLTDKRYLDYTAIMSEAINSLKSDDELRNRLATRIRHVIVDEYQDVNPIHESLIELLSKSGAFVCVVGDDDQSIYQWNGADVSNIMTFEERYSPVKPIQLQENFRSSLGIVETAKEFISKNEDRLEKAMVPASDQLYEAGDISALHFDTPELEAKFIADTINQLHSVAFVENGKTRGLAYSDFAVLLRSVSANGAPILTALQDAGIPAIVVGMNNLFSTPEAEAARQTFYFMANRAGVDAKSLKKYWQDAKLGIKTALLDKAILRVAAAREELGTPDQKRWALYSIQRQFRDFLDCIELREEDVPDSPTGVKRGEIVFYNLGKFSQVISDYEEIYFRSDPPEKYEGFANFLQYQAEDAYPEGWLESTYANPNAVRIMTVHQAKGMQWPVVFIPALLKNRFPAAKVGGKSVWHLIPADAIKGQGRYSGGLEDERRLFYVAMTRSQKYLFMTYAPVPGKNNRYAEKSEFWDDILVSKFVKRTKPNFASRDFAPSEAKAGVSNVVLSFSDLKYYFQCPYQFKLRVLYGFNPPIYEGLGYGKSLHDALAEVHARAIHGKAVHESDSADLVATHLHLPYAYKDLHDTLEASATDIISKYISKNKADFNKIEFSEKAIELQLGDGISVIGRIDLVRRKDTDEVTVVDMKTAERSQAEDVTEMQLHIYALGYQELTGRRADYVEVYELEQQKPKPRSVDDDFLSAVRSNVAKAATNLRLGKLEPLPGQSSCTKCDFRRLCSHGTKYEK